MFVVCESKEYINLQTGEKLDLDKVSTLKENAMLRVKPELWCEWDFEKNNELGFDIWKMTKGSGKKVWWICLVCRSDYDVILKDRVTKKYACPFCSGRRTNHTNSLATLNPNLAAQWHPTKNGELTPHDVTCNSGKKAWWQCKLGHEWETIIASRNSGCSCPYCSGHKVWKGYNDLWTTNPELASLLVDPDDGYKYMKCSNKRVDWICPNCQEIINNKIINNIYNNSLSCKKCSDNISFGEKVIYELLCQLNISFEKEINFKWLQNKRYDFYLPSYNMIIEVHGIQHYEHSGFATLGGRSFEEEQVNDNLKYNMAIENGIEHYVIIDSRNSDLEWIKKSIMGSDLAKIFDLSTIKWQRCLEYACNSLVKVVCEHWHNGKRNIGELSKEIKINKSTVAKYLKRGQILGWISYDAKTSKINAVKETGKKNRKGVVQLSKDNYFIKNWNSLISASKELNINYKNLSASLRGEDRTAGGFKWMYKEDYDEMIAEQENKSDSA